ncbi:hypothetical protein CYOC110262_15820 [Cytobacillus oceanisediminis]
MSLIWKQSSSLLFRKKAILKEERGFSLSLLIIIVEKF